MLNMEYRRLVGELSAHVRTLAATAAATERYAEATREAAQVGLPVGR